MSPPQSAPPANNLSGRMVWSRFVVSGGPLITCISCQVGAGTYIIAPATFAPRMTILLNHSTRSSLKQPWRAYCDEDTRRGLGVVLRRGRRHQATHPYRQILG